MTNVSFLKVEGHENLIRDSHSGAIISTDDAAFNAYMKKRKEDAKKNQLLKQQAEEIQSLKSDMQEIKEMLNVLLKGKQ